MPTSHLRNQSDDFNKVRGAQFSMRLGLTKWFKFILTLNIFLLNGFVQSQANGIVVMASQSTDYILPDCFHQQFNSVDNHDESIIKKSEKEDHGALSHVDFLIELEEETEEEKSAIFEDHHVIENALITQAIVQPQLLLCRTSFLKKLADQTDPVACYLLIQEFRI